MRQRYPKDPHSNLTVVEPTMDNNILLKNAHCAFVYTSSACAQSLVEGVPVYYSGPKVPWVHACRKDEEYFHHARRGDDPPSFSAAMVRKYYYLSIIAQWDKTELAHGVPWQFFNIKGS